MKSTEQGNPFAATISRSEAAVNLVGILRTIIVVVSSLKASGGGVDFEIFLVMTGGQLRDRRLEHLPNAPPMCMKPFLTLTSCMQAQKQKSGKKRKK
jgi:hypothetical protein